MPAQCIDSTYYRAGYGALSAESFAILKSFFTNNKTLLLIKSRRAQVCRTLLMHWFVYFVSERSSCRHANSRKFLHAAILSRVSEWSGSGTNTRLRTRLPQQGSWAEPQWGLGLAPQNLTSLPQKCSKF